MFERLLALDEPDIVNVGNRIKTEWPDDCSVTTGDDDGRYVNLMIQSDNAGRTWAAFLNYFSAAIFLAPKSKSPLSLP